MKNNELLDEIAKLTRAELDDDAREYPFPSFGPERMSFVRICRLSRFWEAADLVGRDSLQQATQDLLATLYGNSKPWLFLLKGTRGRVECWFGLAAEPHEARAWISAAYPDVRIDQAARFDESCLGAYGFAVLQTGPIGLPSAGGGDGRPDAVESVVRGLLGAEWLYAVSARPLPRQDVVRVLNDRLERIWEVHADYLQKDGASGDANRIARRYAELLETELSRYEQGRAQGMWIAQIALLTAQQRDLSRARAVLHGAFSTSGTASAPVRTHRCSTQVRGAPLREVMSTAELARLARPPAEEFPGLELTEYVRFGVGPAAEPQPRSGRILLGTIIDRGIL